MLKVDVWDWHVIDALPREAARNPSEHLDTLAAELERLSPIGRDRPHRNT